MLEKVGDPALESQIISRAHRMGALGPVHVQLLQVRSEDTYLDNSSSSSSSSSNNNNNNN